MRPTTLLPCWDSRPRNTPASCGATITTVGKSSKANINYAIADRALERVAGGTGGYSSVTLASYFGRSDYNFRERGHVSGNGASRWFVTPEQQQWRFSVLFGRLNISNESFAEGRPEFIDHQDPGKLGYKW